MHIYIKKSLPISLLLAVTIFIVNFLPNHGIVLPEVINSSHALVFFLANLFLLTLLLGIHHSSKHIIIISAFSVSIGILIELIQPYFGRDRSLIDVIYDVVGVGFSILFFSVNIYSKRSLMVCFFLIVSAFPLFKYWLWWQVNHSSDILTFERIWEPLTYTSDQDVHLEILKIDDDSSTKVGKLTLGSQPTYPGLNLDHPRLDWSSFSTLHWELKSLNDTPFTMNLRIHDIDHNNEYEDRFNYRFEVKTGLNKYRLTLNDIKHAPRSREMDLTKIRNMKFFITRPNKTTTVYIDNVKLR